MITVYDFMNLCYDDGQIYEIWDGAVEAIVWRGTIDNVPHEYEYMEVESYDSVPYGLESAKVGYYQVITINVWSE